MNLWLRLYTDLPSCQKLRRLPTDTQLAYVWFLCLHKEGRLVGATPAAIAWELRASDADVDRWLADLTASGLLLGDRTPKGWEERQFASDGSTPRVRAWRAKHAAETDPKRPCNVPGKRCGNVSETADVTDQRQRQSQRQNREDGAPLPPAGGDRADTTIAGFGSVVVVGPPADEAAVTAEAERQGCAGFDAVGFFGHYAALGWLMGGTPIRDWRRLLKKWHARQPPESAMRTDGKSRFDAALEKAQREYDERQDRYEREAANRG